ncbi:MAG TPA: hypothetical protein VNQ90_08080 [Chthoniobacteraceae bacterium]|nr:hypothetical protein [Chthoniobacteraceae bacterium]
MTTAPLISLPAEISQLPQVRAAFAASERLPLRQAWLTEQEPAFRPASVATGWQAGEFLVFAELEDDDIYSDAAGLNDETWEKGDVFEMFFRSAAQAEYQEFHLTPNGCHLQLRIPSRDDLVDRDKRHAVMQDFELSPEVFQSRVWIEPGRWSVLARIPLSELRLPDEPSGCSLKFSFSRYDATRGREPVLSSTSDHQVLNFHRQQEWRSLVIS